MVPWPHPGLVLLRTAQHVVCAGHTWAHREQRRPCFRNPLLPIQQWEVSDMLTARLAPLSSQISEYISITWLHHGMHSSCLNSCSSARICPGGCFPSSDLIYTGVTCLKVYLLFFREWEENLLPCHQWSNTSSTETSRSYSTWLKKRKVSYHLPTLQS